MVRRKPERNIVGECLRWDAIREKSRWSGSDRTLEIRQYAGTDWIVKDSQRLQGMREAYIT